MLQSTNAASSGFAPGAADEFYVGYLKTPARLRKFLIGLVTGAVTVFAVSAWMLGAAQNNPGSGVWNDANGQSWTGIIELMPYPLIRISANGAKGGVETILLVDQGKHGAGARAAAFDHQLATVRGTLLERDGRQLIELAEVEAITKPNLNAQIAAPIGPQRVVSLGEVTLRGEIIDPKCYCGAMKPGEGKPHKECATRCISGGIPPMFVTTDAAGEHAYFLLTNTDGHALDDRILPFVADAVEIMGSLELHDDLCYFKIDPAAIRRL